MGRGAGLVHEYLLLRPENRGVADYLPASQQQLSFLMNVSFGIFLSSSKDSRERRVAGRGGAGGQEFEEAREGGGV